jgi:DNA repair and recombination protein RAD54B
VLMSNPTPIDASSRKIPVPFKRPAQVGVSHAAPSSKSATALSASGVVPLSSSAASHSNVSVSSVADDKGVVCAAAPFAPRVSAGAASLFYTVIFQKQGPQKVRKTFDGVLELTSAGRVTLVDDAGGHVARESVRVASFKEGDTLEVGRNDVEIVAPQIPAPSSSARSMETSAAKALPRAVGAPTQAIFRAPVMTAKAPGATENLPPDDDTSWLYGRAEGNPEKAAVVLSVGASAGSVGAGATDGRAVAAGSRPVMAHAAGAPGVSLGVGIGGSKSAPSDAVILQAAGEGGGSCDVALDARLASKMRPHQKEGVRFLWRAINGLTGSGGSGAILADDMGLGKTLSTIAVIFTALRTSARPGGVPLLRKVVVCVPSSLVGNWKAEFKKWLGDERCRPIAVTQLGKDAELKINDFALGSAAVSPVLLISFEMLRKHIALLTTPRAAAAIGLLVCDEGHRLKSAAGNQTTAALAALPTPRRILLTGTPIQNDLDEFYGLSSFVNPDGPLGTLSHFRRYFSGPISAGRDRDAVGSAAKLGAERAAQLSQASATFLLRRTAEVLDSFLPPKTEHVVMTRLGSLQSSMYAAVVASYRRSMSARGGSAGGAGVSPDALVVLNALRKICSHPDSLLLNDLDEEVEDAAGAAEPEPEEEGDTDDAVPAASASRGLKRAAPSPPAASSTKGVLPNFSALITGGYDPGALIGGAVPPSAPASSAVEAAIAASGKLSVLDSILRATRSAAPTDRVVLVSSYATSLDLMGALCAARGWGTLRLDGSTPSSARQAIVSAFNAPDCPAFALLLSAAAGGAGLNLIGANILVLWDANWNPAVDHQALARVWRDGQRKHVYIYRLLAAWSLEEKVLQRQLLKGDMSTALGFDGAARGAGSAAASSSASSSGGLSRAELMSLFEIDPTGGDQAALYSCDSVRILAGAPASAAGARPRLDAAWPPYTGPASLSDKRLAAAALEARVTGCDAEAVAFVRTLHFNVDAKVGAERT